MGVSRSIWFMHDVVHAHFVLHVNQYLDKICHSQRIVQEIPVAQAPRFPDLNPLDYYLWNHLDIRPFGIIFTMVLTISVSTGNTSKSAALHDEMCRRIAF